MRIARLLSNSIWTRVALATVVFTLGIQYSGSGCLAQEPAEETGGVMQEPDWLKTIVPEDPAVLAILETKPNTPAELLRAARILADLKRPDLAKEMIKKVAEANLDAAALASLVDQLGEAAFIEMSSKTTLQPEIGPLVDKALAAYQTRLRDTARLEKLVAQLGDDSPKVRADAAVGLVQAGPYAVAPLMQALSDSDKTAWHKPVRGVLLRLGPDAVKPLVAMLNADETTTVQEAISLLGAIGDKGAALYLLATYAEHFDDAETRDAAARAIEKLVATAPTRQQAANVLMTRARRYFDGRQPMETDATGNVPVWVYDLQQKAPVLKTLPPEQARRRMAVKLSRAATILLPDDAAATRLYLTCVFEEAAYRTGLDKITSGELTAFADKVSPKMLEAALVEAMETGHVPAAVIAVRRLATVESPESLSSGEVSPMVKAMQHPDRRLRLAAVGAILDLNPTVPFPGAGRLVDTLSFFASSRGRSQALVVGPQISLLQTLVGELTAAGFKVDTAVTGREAMRLLLANPDYEVLFVDAALNKPDVDSFLQQLRRDPRTALLPVAVMAREGYREKADRVAEKIPHSAAFPRPHDEKAVKWQLAELRKLAGDSAVSPSARLSQAADALSRLAAVGESGGAIFDVRKARKAVTAALKSPESMKSAVRVLSTIPTPESQETLVDLASRKGLPLEIRQAAAKAFCENVQRYGVQLTVPRIQKQYDRYNASRELDKPTQELLASILDVIEDKDNVEEKKAKKEDK